MAAAYWGLRRLKNAGPGLLRWFPTKVGQWRSFWRTYRLYQAAASGEWRVAPRYLDPHLGDDHPITEIEPIYFYQDAWAFERIFNASPTWHLDVGSHHKFVALLSKVVAVTMVDLRPLSLPLDSLNFIEGSILHLPFGDGTVPSVSSICVIEHVGLGRYGDEIDPNGSTLALAELKRVVAPGGNLYISVPLDDANRVYFNAHRAFTEDYLLRLFVPFELVERKYIFGSSFGPHRGRGFGTGCYHLKAP